jgi:DivIVA domain-containing protein
VTLVFMLAGFVVIAVVALLAVGRLGELPDAEPDRAPLALPEDRVMVPEDVDAVRFAVSVRGYRMDEVDDVLDRLAGDISTRDARIAELEAALAGPAAADSAPAPETLDGAAATEPGHDEHGHGHDERAAAEEPGA